MDFKRRVGEKDSRRLCQRIQGENEEDPKKKNIILQSEPDEDEQEDSPGDDWEDIDGDEDIDVWEKQEEDWEEDKSWDD